MIGKKYLIIGNYDTFIRQEYLDHGFDEVITNDFIVDICVNEDCPEDMKLLNLTHYPTKSISDRLNLVGHIHGTWKVQKNMINVGVDAWHFCPVSLNQIQFTYNAICKFYDQDVWVGDHPANTAHNNRGKAGTYWENDFTGTRNDNT